MASFVVKKEIKIQQQEGDSGDISIQVPAILPITDTDVTFRVYNGSRTIFEKTKPAIQVTGQNILIPLNITDTDGNSGAHAWELIISNNTNGHWTIGKGIFEIIERLIK